MIEELKNKEIKALKNKKEKRVPVNIFYKVEIVFSFNIPSDGFTLKYDKDKELIGGVYWSTYDREKNWKYQECRLTIEEAKLIEDYFIKSRLNKQNYGKRRKRIRAIII